MMKFRKTSIYLSIISCLLIFLSGCAGEPKPMNDLSEICNTENMGKLVEIKGYFDVGDTMSCISKNNSIKKCGLKFRSELGDEKSISVLIKQTKFSNIPNTIKESSLNIEELEILDFEGKPLSPRSKVTLIGYIQNPEEFAKATSDICVVDVSKIKVSEQEVGESSGNNGFCSGKQTFDYVGEQEIMNKFNERGTIKDFYFSQVYSNQKNPKTPKELCNSYAEGMGKYRFYNEKKKAFENDIYHRVAFYYKPEEAIAGLKEYVELKKSAGANIISDVKMEEDNRKFTASYTNEISGTNFTNKINCYPEVIKVYPTDRIVCHEFSSVDETYITRYSEAFFEDENKLIEIRQAKTIDLTSMSPTEVIKAFYKAIQEKDVAGFREMISYKTEKSLFDAPRNEEVLNLKIKNYLQKNKPSIKGEVEVRNEQIDGSKATLEVKHSGTWNLANLVKEKQVWKIAPDE